MRVSSIYDEAFLQLPREGSFGAAASSHFYTYPILFRLNTSQYYKSSLQNKKLEIFTYQKVGKVFQKLNK